MRMLCQQLEWWSGSQKQTKLHTVTSVGSRDHRFRSIINTSIAFEISNPSFGSAKCYTDRVQWPDCPVWTTTMTMMMIIIMMMILIKNTGVLKPGGIPKQEVYTVESRLSESQSSETTFSSFYVQTTKNQRLLHAIKYCVISIKYCILYVLYCIVTVTLS